MTESVEKKGLMAPRNLGEFAFAWCVTGIGLLPLAILIVVMLAAALGDLLPYEKVTAAMWFAVLLVWLLLQLTVLFRLRRHAATWPAIVREDRQMRYLELSAATFCCVAELTFGRDDSGVVHGLRYVFGSWMLLLIVAHIITYVVFRVGVTVAQAVTWLIMALTAVWVFRGIIQ